MEKRKFREPDEATRQKMSIKKQGTLNPMSGKNHTQKSKDKISQALRSYWEGIPSSKSNSENKTESL